MIIYITYTKIFLQFTKNYQPFKLKQGLFNKNESRCIDVKTQNVCEPPLL